MQERLRDCTAGGHTQTRQPILPQSPNYQGASWDCGHLRQSGCQNLYTGRGLQNFGENPKGGQLGFSAPFKKCRGRFSRTYSSASQCPCRHQRWTPLAPPEGRSSLTDIAGPIILVLTYWPQRPGPPLRFAETAKRRTSTQGRSRLVAAVAGGTANWAKCTS